MFIKSSQILLGATLCVASLSCVSAASVTRDEFTVDVTVKAANRDLAYAQAVPEAARVLVARAVPTASPLYGQAVRQFSVAELRPLKILREYAVAGGVQMVVQVAAKRGAAERALVKAQPQLAQKRIAVLIPEAIIRRPTPDPAAETEIVRAFIEGGLRVVDPGQQKLNATREVLRASKLSSAAIADVKTRLNADVLVTGEAFAEETATMRGGLEGYTARLEIKIVDLASGQILHSEAFQGSGIGASDSLAGKTALMNVGRKAAQTVPSSLIRSWQKEATTATVATVVRIQPPITFAEVNELSRQLKAQGVSDVATRSVDKGGAVLNMQYNKSISDLAALLEKTGFVVESLSGGEITIKANNR